MSKYRLLKDLPDYKAGMIFEWDGYKYYRAQEPCVDNEYGRWPQRYVENNPDWFELYVPEPLVYTEAQMRSAERGAFIGGRLPDADDYDLKRTYKYMYPTFEDYQKEMERKKSEQYPYCE